jgi:hypothetical protein
MWNIAAFLEKYKNVGVRELVFKEALAHSIQEETGAAVDVKNIDIKDGIVRIKTSPAQRSAIFIKKEKILEKTAQKSNLKIKSLL